MKHTNKIISTFTLIFTISISLSCNPTEEYQSPIGTRYASKAMGYLYSYINRTLAFRQVWIALAEEESKLGLNISQKQISELKTNIKNIDLSAISSYEQVLKHDVMAHVHAYGDVCPTARPIIHLGATSCLITDNADVLILRDALQLIKKRLIALIRTLSNKSIQYKDLACLSFTHFQVAQPSTLGKRMTLWLQDLYTDFQEIEYRLENLKLLGIKGATGTQASFLELFDGDHKKVKQLEKNVVKTLGFEKVYAVSGQTYSRKQDVEIVNALAGIAISLNKIATDIRLLAHMREVEEPFSEKQIGSSAMPYKRNPMKCERICSLSRLVISNAQNPQYTAATQWFERTLDDSANRRVSIPEAFLITDAILNLSFNVIDEIVVNEKIIEKNLFNELPFIATENILMACVKKGADRQDIHEVIRTHSIAVATKLKAGSQINNLIERLIKDKNIPLNREEINKLLDVKKFIGRSAEQVVDFVSNDIKPILEQNAQENIVEEINV